MQRGEKIASTFQQGGASEVRPPAQAHQVLDSVPHWLSYLWLALAGFDLGF
jgi:hypothetical protein